MNSVMTQARFSTRQSTLVSIIIVNWNGLDHLEVCLESLKAQTCSNFEVVLVDNGSRDGSPEFVRERYPWVKLVVLKENAGFATGNNIGYENASGEYIVTLNNDTKAEPGWLAELVAVADENPDAGMIGCRTTSFDDPNIVDTLGGRVCRDGMSRGANRLARFSDLGLKRVEEALYPSACAALYKRAMIVETGFFDDDFFAYCEDTDLGLRGRLAGWRALLATEAIIRHRYSGTAGSFSPLKLYLVERNHYWVALKNFPIRLLLLVPFFTLVRYLVQVEAVLSAKGSGGEFLACGSRWALIKAILKGTRDTIAGMPRMLGKRAQVMNTRKITDREMISLLKKYRIGFRELLDGSGA